MWSDGIVTPHPPILKALRDITSRLKECKSGFDIVDWVPYRHDECWKITRALYFEDGGQEIRQALRNGGESACHLTE